MSTFHNLHFVQGNNEYDYYPQVDNTLSVEGRAADALEAGKRIKEVKNSITFAETLTWVKGKVNTSSSATNYGSITSASDRLTTAEVIPVCDAEVTGNGKIDAFAYGAYFNFLGVAVSWQKAISVKDILDSFSEAKYVRFGFKRDDGTNTETEDVSTYGIVVKQSKFIASQKEDLETAGILHMTKMMQGGLTSQNGLDNTTSQNRIVSPNFIPVKSGGKYIIEITENNQIRITVSFYDANDFMTPRTATSPFTSGRKKIITVPQDVAYMRVLAGYASGNITPDEVGVMIVRRVEDEIDYVIGADLIKKPISMINIGESKLTYKQSFTVYNGYYYSTDGEHISKQDGAFNEILNVTINVGHGNNFQLGNGSYAYISGWNDNRIYVVDLDTLTLYDTIVLPTQGYTTCAVDELKQLVYIFQRNTSPSTEEQYNFIVCDLQNNQIVSSKKTTIKMAAMQAIDLYHDRIVVMHGAGISTKPNGYHIFDTSGNIVADLIIGTLENIEPEGVFVDRENGNLLISDYNKSVYQINYK